MAQIKINTSQNVEIGYSTASVLRRISSQIIDILIIISYVLIVLRINDWLNINDIAMMYIEFLPVAFYSFIMETFFQGQSVGKMLLSIRVVKLDGSQASLLSYFIRWMFRLIDIIISNGFIATLLVAASKNSQRLGDIAAGTTVVNLKKKHNFKYSIYQEIPDDYNLQFPDIEKLTEVDLKTVIDVLKLYDEQPSSSSRALLVKTKNAIQRKMGANSTLSEHDFLTTVVKDYNFWLRNEEY